jgi:hypothetical protein
MDGRFTTLVPIFAITMIRVLTSHTSQQSISFARGEVDSGPDRAEGFHE